MCIFISALHERKLRSKFSQPVSVFDPTSPDFQGRSAPKARSVSFSALGAGAREDLRWECIDCVWPGQRILLGKISVQLCPCHFLLMSPDFRVLTCEMGVRADLWRGHW